MPVGGDHGHSAKQEGQSNTPFIRGSLWAFLRILMLSFYFLNRHLLLVPLCCFCGKSGIVNLKSV